MPRFFTAAVAAVLATMMSTAAVAQTTTCSTSICAIMYVTVGVTGVANQDSLTVRNAVSSVLSTQIGTVTDIHAADTILQNATTQAFNTAASTSTFAYLFRTGVQGSTKVTAVANFFIAKSRVEDLKSSMQTALRASSNNALSAAVVTGVDVATNSATAVSAIVAIVAALAAMVV